jgi:hypothetical protein
MDYINDTENPKGQIDIAMLLVGEQYTCSPATSCSRRIFRFNLETVSYTVANRIVISHGENIDLQHIVFHRVNNTMLRINTP